MKNLLTIIIFMTLGGLLIYYLTFLKQYYLYLKLKVTSVPTIPVEIKIIIFLGAILEKIVHTYFWLYMYNNLFLFRIISDLFISLANQRVVFFHLLSVTKNTKILYRFFKHPTVIFINRIGLICLIWSRFDFAVEILFIMYFFGSVHCVLYFLDYIYKLYTLYKIKRNSIYIPFPLSSLALNFIYVITILTFIFKINWLSNIYLFYIYDFPYIKNISYYLVGAIFMYYTFNKILRLLLVFILFTLLKYFR